MPACRAARPLDGGNMRRRYRLKFGHGAPRGFEGLAELTQTKAANGATIELNNERSAMACSKSLTLKNLIGEGEEPE
jgi:hypothetical protein